MKPMKDAAKAQVISLMRKMISRSEETKYVGTVCTPKTNIPANITLNSMWDVLPPLPEVTDATTGHGRLGDRVTPKGLILRGYVGIDSNEARSLTPEVHVMVVSHKSKKSYAALEAGTNAGKLEILSNLYDTGDGNAIGFDGTVPPTLFPYNKKSVNVLAHKRFKLASSYGATANEHSADDTKRWARFEFKLSCPKVFIYDNDLDAAQPTNFAPELIVGFTYPDDTPPEVNTNKAPVVVYAASQLYYDDA